MTREEALNRVKGYLTDIIPIEGYSEVEEIVKALDQEPCEDCISRQAVIELCEGWWLGHTKEDDFATEVRALPSVNPQEPKTDTWSIKDVANTLAKHGLIAEQEPCEDAVSRKEVLELIEDINDTVFGQVVSKGVMNLPSVNSQKIGHWILTDDDFVYCSECEDSYYPRPIDAGWYYCPHCGSAMKGE